MKAKITKPTRPMRDDTMKDLIGDVSPIVLPPPPTRIMPSEPPPKRRRRRRKAKHPIHVEIQKREREIAALKRTARMLGVPLPGELSSRRRKVKAAIDANAPL